MVCPTTKEEWWKSVDANWHKIEDIIMRYYPNQSDFPMAPLQAPQPACNTVIKKLRKENPIWETKEKFKAHICALKKDQDARLATICSDAWFSISEAEGTRRIPGFHTFCNLCSESYLLYEGETGKALDD